jgi:hypothetical protein
MTSSPNFEKLVGSGGGLQTEVAELVYYDAKILLVMEEADSSQLNQMFDQLVARNDKRVLRESLGWLNNNKGTCKGKISSWDLCHVALACMRRCPAEAWVRSAIRVNIHPHHRKSFAYFCTAKSGFLQVPPYRRSAFDYM